MLKDALNVTILPSDNVMVTAWGIARLVDVRTKSQIIRINRTRVIIIDSDGYERSVLPAELTVLRRDGAAGFEGNKDS
jgi:hypothetical protein